MRGCSRGESEAYSINNTLKQNKKSRNKKGITKKKQRKKKTGTPSLILRKKEIAKSAPKLSILSDKKSPNLTRIPEEIGGGSGVS